MKIVYCIHGTFNSGGMERVLANKANYWSENKKYQTYIITTEQKGRVPFFYFHPSIKHYDLNINYGEDINCSFVVKIFRFFRKKKLHRKRLTALLYEIKADIVISMFGNETSFLPAIKDGSKKVLEIHFSKFFRLQHNRTGLWKLVDKFRSWQDENTVQKFDRFIVLTHEDKAFWHSQHNITVIPNANLLVSTRSAELTNCNVITVGRLSYQKGFDRLIEAWSIVHKTKPDWCLSIFGDGELKKELSAQIISLKLEDSIKILPPTLNIGEEYYRSSLFVLSSHYEGLPMVLLESMAYGLPVVAFACKCGPKDIITNGKDGLLIEEGNIFALAEGIIKLICDEKLRKQMGKAAYLKSKSYSEDIIMEKWQELFLSLLSN